MAFVYICIGTLSEGKGNTYMLRRFFIRRSFLLLMYCCRDPCCRLLLTNKPGTNQKYKKLQKNAKKCKKNRERLRYNPNKVAAFARRREMLTVFLAWARKGAQLAVYVVAVVVYMYCCCSAMLPAPAFEDEFQKFVRWLVAGGGRKKKKKSTNIVNSGGEL